MYVLITSNYHRLSFASHNPSAGFALRRSFAHAPRFWSELASLLRLLDAIFADALILWKIVVSQASQ